jgi:hypothetical protein
MNGKRQSIPGIGLILNVRIVLAELHQKRIVWLYIILILLRNGTRKKMAS